MIMVMMMMMMMMLLDSFLKAGFFPPEVHSFDSLKIFYRFSSNFLQSLNKFAGNANNSARFGLPRNQKGFGKTLICVAVVH